MYVILVSVVCNVVYDKRKLTWTDCYDVYSNYISYITTWYDVRMKRRADCPICHEKVGLPGEKIMCGGELSISMCQF